MISVRRIAYLCLCAGVLLSSFFLTLWLTNPERTPPAAADSVSEAERLASQTVSNGLDLTAAASAIGFKSSPRLRGNVDKLERISDREVIVAGWLADTEGDGSRQNIVVFAGGKRAAVVQTQGGRSDVTKALGLSSGAAKNVMFRAAISCQTASQVHFAGVGSAGQYIDMGSRACP